MLLAENRGSFSPRSSLDARAPAAYAQPMSEPVPASPSDLSSPPSPARDVASFDPVPLLAAELTLPRSGVSAVVALLAEGATVPFIARYRKEATGGFDEVQIRAIEERRAYLLELEERRGVVLAEIGKQGKLTDSLKKRILACATKADLEDLYLPYKPKRRTRSTIAKERGLEPLADRMWAQPSTGTPAPRPRPSSTPPRRCPTSSARSPAPATSAPSASPRTPTCASTCARPS